MSNLFEAANLEAIEVEPTNVKVYNQIRRAVSNGAFQPGAGLSTREIAKALRVSQTPVREAFQRLVAERGLEKRSNRTIGIPILSIEAFDEVTEIRVKLEGFATEKATANCDAPLSAKLHGLVAQMEALTIPSQVDEHLKLNREFHFAIYSASQSDALVTMIDQLWLQVGPLLNWSARNMRNSARSNTHHSNICKAISRSSPESARQSLESDILEAAKDVREAIKRFEQRD